MHPIDHHMCQTQLFHSPLLSASLNDAIAGYVHPVFSFVFTLDPSSAYAHEGFNHNGNFRVIL